MLVKDITKGMRVQLKNGWFATMLDNKKNGTTRLATVEGYFTETGSIYNHTIDRVLTADGYWTGVELNKKELECQALDQMMFG